MNASGYWVIFAVILSVVGFCVGYGAMDYIREHERQTVIDTYDFVDHDRPTYGGFRTLYGGHGLYIVHYWEDAISKDGYACMGCSDVMEEYYCYEDIKACYLIRKYIEYENNIVKTSLSFAAHNDTDAPVTTSFFIKNGS